MGTLGHEQKFEMPSLKRLLSEAESTFDFYLKTPLKGVTQMIGWPFSKSEDDDSDEENRHSASSEEDCEEMKKKYGWELKRVELSRRRFKTFSRLRVQRQTDEFLGYVGRPSR